MKYKVLVAEADNIIEKRVRQANLAVDQNEDNVAKIALQNKIVPERKFASYKQQEIIQAQAVNLYEKIKKLKGKHEELKPKQQELIARADAAKAVKAIQTTINSFSTDDDDTIRGFARMEECIWTLEAEAKAGQAFAAHRRPRVNTILQLEVELQLERLKAAKA